MERKQEKAFSFVRVNKRSEKPRDRGITEIRDRVLGLRQLQDLCEAAGDYIDILKIGSMQARFQDRDFVKKKIELCRQYQIDVSTGGSLESAVPQGPPIVVKFVEEAKDLGFTYIEVSSGNLILSLEHKLELIKLVKEYGLRPKPEVSVAHGITPETKVSISVDKLIKEIDKCLEVGCDIVLLESEGITENVKEWRVDVIHKIAASFDLTHLQFEAADPLVFNWYMKNFGPDVNLFVDSSQIMACEGYRSGLLGSDDTWGRVATFIRPKKD